MPGRRRSSARRGNGRSGANPGTGSGPHGGRSAPYGSGHGSRGAGSVPHPEAEGSEPEQDPGEIARSIALRLLAVRPRTRAELDRALRRRGVPADVAETVLERFGEVGLIDDAAFAEAWVSSRHHGRGLARRALGHELRRRGVDGDTVRDALERLDSETEEETARTLVARKLRTMNRVAPDAAFRRLVGMLARKGYPAGLAFRVVQDALAGQPGDTSFLENIDLDALGDDEAAHGSLGETRGGAGPDI